MGVVVVALVVVVVVEAVGGDGMVEYQPTQTQLSRPESPPG